MNKYRHALHLILATLPVHSETLADFDGNDVSYVESGTGAVGITAGGPTGSYYRLLNSVNSLHNFISFDSDDTNPDNDYTGWRDFTFSMDFHMASAVADGFGINFLSTAAHGHSGSVNLSNGGAGGSDAERAFMPDALGVGLRVYQGRNSTVTFDDALFSPDSPYTFADGTWGSLEITVVRDAVTRDAIVNVNLYDQAGLTGNVQALHSDVEIPALLLEDFRVQIGGRTGGLNMTLDFDNIELDVNVPDDTDTDGDGLPDEWEAGFNLDPNDNGLNPNNNGVPGDPAQGAGGDPDNDTLTNAEEFALGTSPDSDDSDDDGLKDNVEDGGGVYVGPDQTGTSPTLDDSDRDGLLDGVEVPTEDFVDETQSGTDPNKDDSDEDGLKDREEILLGRNPTIDDIITPNGDLIADFDGNGEPFEEAALRTARQGVWIPGSPESDGNYYQLLDTMQDAGNFISFESSEDYTGWKTISFQMDYLASNVEADGFSISLLSTAAHGESGVIPLLAGSVEERGLIENSLGVAFRTYQGTNSTLTWNATDVSGDAPYTITQGTWASLAFDITRDPATKEALVDVYLYDQRDRQGTVQTIFEDFSIENVDLEDFRVQIAGRTGGLAMRLGLDNIKLIVDGGAQKEVVISSVDTTVVPGNGGNPDTLSVDLTWNSQPGQAYTILASDDLSLGNLDLWDELTDNFVGTPGQETSTFTETGLPIGTRKRFYVVRLSE